MARRPPPPIATGANRPPPRAQSRPPISVNGFSTRSTGRRRIESSPVRTENHGWAASKAGRTRRAVPELPTSRTSPGSVRPKKPEPATVAVVPSSAISTPSRLKQSRVLKQSAETKMLERRARPSAMAEKMRARWVIDLSPGTDKLPERRCGPLILTLSFTDWFFDYLVSVLLQPGEGFADVRAVLDRQLDHAAVAADRYY